MSVKIKIKNAKKMYGDLTVIENLSLEVNNGEFFTLLGPSGCGKTTLLRMIAGFNTIEGGSFYFDDRLINNMPSYKRNVGMIFQNYAIFPHLSVKNNVGFGLKERKVKEPLYTQKIEEILESVQIRDLINRMPSQMSGGQQQRIALARAIVIEPDVLLMDEPLSNLDAKLRIEMRKVIKDIQNENQITTIYVTHDQEEALSMSDRIAVMNKGEIQQIGSPREIYNYPSNLFVATFIGSSNIIDGSLVKEKNSYYVKIFDKKYLIKNLLNKKQKEIDVDIVIRPGDMSFADQGIKGTITDSMYLGAQVQYSVELENKQVIEVHLDANEKVRKINEKIKIDFKNNAIKIFDKKTNNTLIGI